MALQRPIVFYENLMHTYDQQVAELLAAKTEYIFLATDDGDFPKKTTKQHVTVEILKPQRSRNTKKSITPKTKKVVDKVSKVNKPKSIKTGLGLSLDDILSEEESSAARDDNGYFKEH
ncbi:hypothetical protein [Weissella fangxianensis]|uniref:hypothetical protein n=1 Tax=Weissella fangxianensis TaxID=2953879 RepID=UPI002157A9C9|nr:hypothetical protein [Weissella fangxianensis]